MFPLRFSPVIAALVLVVGLGAAVLISSPTTAGPGGAWIGVRLQDLDENLREAMNIDRHVQGALVSDVMDDSPAEKAGLEDGDVIVEVAGHRTTNVDEVTSAVRGLEPGEKGALVVIRNGQSRGLDIVPSSRSESFEWTDQGDKGDRKVRKFVFKSDKDHARKMEQYFEQDEKGDQDRQIRFFRADANKGGYLGVQSMEVGQLADYFGAAEDEGVLITEVVEESPAAEAGLKAGDVILAVGDEEVGDPEELREAVRDQKPGETVRIEILRKGERSTVTAKLGDASDMGDAEMYFMSPEDGHLMIPEIPRIPRAPRIDIQAPNFQWRGDGDAHVLRLDDEELQKFKEELHKSLDEMRKQLDEMKRELKRSHEDEDTD